MAFEKELPQWKEKGVKPPQSKLDEGWKVQDKPPAAWLNWQMNKTYEALKEVQEKAAEKTEVSSAIENAKKYTDQKVKDIDLSKITTESIGAAKKVDLDTLKKEAVSRKYDIYNDFNQYTEPGIYNINQIGNIANKPNTFRGTQLDWGVLTVDSTPQGYIIQTYTAVIPNVTVRRTRTESQWSDWRTLLTEYTFQDPVYVAPSTDLNSVSIPGDYMNPANAEVATMANTPTPEAFSLSVYRHAGIHQVFRVFSPHSNKVWKRNYYYGVGWSPWLRVLDENDYNELKQSGVDAKNRIAGALNAKGVTASANDDFATLATKIGQVNTLTTYGVNFSTEISGNDDRKITITTVPVNSETLVFVPVSSFYGYMDVDAHVISGDYRGGYPKITLSMKDSSGNSFTIIQKEHSSRTPERMGETIDFHFLMIELKNRVIKYRLVNDSPISINIPTNFNLTNPISLEVILRTYGYKDSWGGKRDDRAWFNMNGLFYAF